MSTTPTVEQKTQMNIVFIQMLRLFSLERKEIVRLLQSYSGTYVYVPYTGRKTRDPLFYLVYRFSVLCHWKRSKANDPVLENLLLEMISFIDIMVALKGVPGYRAIWSMETPSAMASAAVGCCWSLLARLSKESLLRMNEEVVPPTLSFEELQPVLDGAFYQHLLRNSTPITRTRISHT